MKSRARQTEFIGDPSGQLGCNPPVRPCLSRRIERLSDPLNPTLRVGERPLLLGEGGCGQEHVGQFCSFVEEQLLDDEAVEVGERPRGVVKIGFREERILADHVHGPD